MHIYQSAAASYRPPCPRDARRLPLSRCYRIVLQSGANGVAGTPICKTSMFDR
jgi:hypothetical protein